MFQIIPAIDVLEGKVVRLLKGDYDKVTVYSEDPILVAKRIKERKYNWVHLVNLDGARYGDIEGVLDIIEKIKQIGLLVEVGGGIREKEDVERLMEVGTDRIVIGTMAFKDKDFLSWALDRVGKEKIVVGMDVKGREVRIRGWMESSGFDIDSAVKYLQGLGVEWILCTDVSRDGTQEGPNLDLYRNLCNMFSGKILASGGVGSWEDIDKVNLLSQQFPNLLGLIVGRFFYETWFVNESK